MFMYGPPGVGKSVIAQILFELLATYAFLIDESFLSKNGGDAKRFDMGDIIGKRMLFMDETQLGMTWDETRMSKAASARKLSVELKFGRRVPFMSRPRSWSWPITNQTSSPRRQAG
jgi:phage/plasmid-associated DNA primase